MFNKDTTPFGKLRIALVNVQTESEVKDEYDLDVQSVSPSEFQYNKHERINKETKWGRKEYTKKLEKQINQTKYKVNKQNFFNRWYKFTGSLDRTRYVKKEKV